MYLNIYYAGDSVSCVICSHSLIIQLNNKYYTAGGICETASCLIDELTSSRDVHFASWQSASLRIRKLSSYPIRDLPI